MEAVLTDGLTRDRIVHDLTRLADYSDKLSVTERALVSGAVSILAQTQFDTRDAVLAGASSLDNLLDIIRNADKYAKAKAELQGIAEKIAADSATAVTAAESAQDDRALAQAAQRDAEIKLATAREQYESKAKELAARAEELEQKAAALAVERETFERDTTRAMQQIATERERNATAQAANEQRAAELTAENERLKALAAEVEDRVRMLTKPMAAA